MTKQELTDLFDSLFYGHDAEIEVNGKKYFIEWSTDGLDVYSINEDTGIKIATFFANEKSEIISKLFCFSFENQLSINDSFSQIILLDIQ